MIRINMWQILNQKLSIDGTIELFISTHTCCPVERINQLVGAIPQSLRQPIKTYTKNRLLYNFPGRSLLIFCWALHMLTLTPFAIPETAWWPEYPDPLSLTCYHLWLAPEVACVQSYHSTSWGVSWWVFHKEALWEICSLSTWLNHPEREEF